MIARHMSPQVSAAFFITFIVNSSILVKQRDKFTMTIWNEYIKCNKLRE